MRTDSQADTRSQLTGAGTARGARLTAPLEDGAGLGSWTSSPQAPTPTPRSSASVPQAPPAQQPLSPETLLHLEPDIKGLHPFLPRFLPRLSLPLCRGPRGSGPQCQVQLTGSHGSGSCRGRDGPARPASRDQETFSPSPLGVASLRGGGDRARKRVPLGLARSQETDTWFLWVSGLPCCVPAGRPSLGLERPRSRTSCQSNWQEGSSQQPRGVPALLCCPGPQLGSGSITSPTLAEPPLLRPPPASLRVPPLLPQVRGRSSAAGSFGGEGF